MTYFNESSEVDHFIGGIFTACLDDPELGPLFAASGLTMRLSLTEPDTELIIDFAGRKVFRSEVVDSAPDTNVEMFMSADVSHEYWLGQRNPTVCLARGEMRAKGPVPKILKLVPLTKHVFPRYIDMIAESGRTELLPAAV